MSQDRPQTRGKNVLLTGAPGIGKTTVIMRLAELLTDRRVGGFYTEEIREAGQRRGFGVQTFSGGQAILAHVNFRSRQRVGRYNVDVAAFEQLVIPEMARECDIMLVDEIGKMECFSEQFVTAVRQLLDSPRPIVATVAIRGGGFIAEAKARSDVEIHEVTKANRDQLPRRLADSLAAVLDK